MMDQRVDIILTHFTAVYDIMANALKEKDQKLALAATEFWSGIIQAVRDDAMDFVVQRVCSKLPELCPLLLDCARYTDYDRQLLAVHEEEQEEEDFENNNITTLRKSSAFTIERFSSKSSL